MTLNVAGRRLAASYGRDLFAGKAGAMSQQLFEANGGEKLVWKQTVVQFRPGRPGSLEGDVYCSPEYKAELVSVSKPHRLSFLADAPLTSSTFRSPDAGADLPRDGQPPVFGALQARPSAARNVHILVGLSDDNIGFFGYANPEGILLVLQQDSDPIQAALKSLSPTKYVSLVEALCSFVESEYGENPSPTVILPLYAQVQDFLTEVLSKPLDTVKERVDFMLDALRALERDRVRQLLVYEDAALVLNSVEALLLPFLDFGGQEPGDFSLLGAGQPYVIVRGDYMVYSFSDVDLLPETALALCTEEDLPEASMPPSMSMTRPRNVTRCVMTPAEDAETLVEYCRFIVSHAVPYVTQIPYAFSFLHPAAVSAPGEAPRPLFYELSERREEFDIQKFCQVAVQERIKRSPFRVYDLTVRAATDEELGLKARAPEKPVQGFLSQAEEAIKDAVAREAERMAAAKDAARGAAKEVDASAEKQEAANGEAPGEKAAEAPASADKPPAKPPQPILPVVVEAPPAPSVETSASVPARTDRGDALFCASLAVMAPKVSVTDFDIGGIFGPGASDVLLEAHYGRILLGGTSFMTPGHCLIPRLARAEQGATSPEDVRLDMVAMSPLLQGKNVSLMVFGVPGK